jgi:hypothetical protein
MIDQTVIAGLKSRYNNIHPLIFHRSVERAKSVGDLFDILESLSEAMDQGSVYPLTWHEEERRWVKTDDLFQSLDFMTKTKAN